MSDERTTRALDAASRHQARPSPRLLAELAREMESTPPRGFRLQRNGRLALSAAWLAVSTLLASPRLALSAPGELLLCATALGVSGAMLLAVALPGPQRRLDLGGRRALACLLTAGLIAALCLRAREFLPWHAAWAETAHGTGCLLHSLGGAVLASAGLSLLWWRTDPFTPGWSGWQLGLIGGLAGTLAVCLGCGSLEGWHLLISHGAAALLSGSALAVTARRWLSI
ncbi:MAG TPA: hypothetical protein VLC09_17505 [Polyangiaceae bacterium]|nr:hypothetical protein [Polyangiaceae bacterium]